jgi:hypothetical protein
LLARLLNAHPAVAVLPETAYFTALERHGALNGFRSRAQFSLLAQTLWESLHSADVAAADLLCDLMARDAVDAADPVALLDELGALYAASHGADVWGEKTPGASRYSNYISERFPGARFIFLVRDPRDIVVSRLGSRAVQPPKLRTNPVPPIEPEQRLQALMYHATVAGRQLRVLRSAMENHRSSLALNYESLVTDTPQTTKQICTYLDIPLATDLPGSMTADPVAARLAQLDHLRRLTEPITDSSVGRYRSSLSSEELEIVEIILRDHLEYFNYSFESDARSRRDGGLPKLQHRFAREIRLRTRGRSGRKRVQAHIAEVPVVGRLPWRGEPLVWGKSVWLAHKEYGASH